MRPAHYTPPTMIKIGPDLLVIMDGGEVWSLATDDPQLERCKKDWENFDPLECQPAEFEGWISRLQQTDQVQRTMQPNTSETSLVRYERINGTAIITLNRADKRNALSRELIDAISDAFIRARDDDAARCVILAAAGSVFCAGMDLAELKNSLDIPPDQTPIWDDAMRLAKLYDLIYTLPKPTIAAVQGAAVAGGAGLVTVCDLAIAVPEARFGYPEVRRGLVAAMVMPHLMRHVGERMARYLLLSGEFVEGHDAVRCGLINEVVSADRLLERALALAKSCAEGGPQALAKTKAFLHQFSKLAVSIEEAAQASGAPRLTQECQQGLRAFFNKQPPPWAPTEG